MKVQILPLQTICYSSLIVKIFEWTLINSRPSIRLLLPLLLYLIVRKIVLRTVKINLETHFVSSKNGKTPGVTNVCYLF